MLPESRLASLRNAFFTGLLLLAPIAVTWLVFSWLVGRVGGEFSDIFFRAVPDSLRENLPILWDVLSTVIVVAAVTLLGYVSRLFLGKFFGQVAERFIQNIPGIGAVYSTVKQIVETFSTTNRSLFSKVVLVEFPRQGVHSIGFLTNKAQAEPQLRLNAESWTVFVPTTPNPTTGYLILVRKEEVVELDMSVGDGMKLVISGGTVTPPWPAAATAGTPVAVAAAGQDASAGTPSS